MTFLIFCHRYRERNAPQIIYSLEEARRKRKEELDIAMNVVRVVWLLVE